MRKGCKKVIATILTAAMAMSVCSPAFASEISTNTFETTLQPKERMLCEQVLEGMETKISQELKTEYQKDILLLNSKGFEEKELIILDTDIRQVANLIQELDMDSEEIKKLKNGFLTSRPTDPEVLIANSHSLDAADLGIVSYEFKQDGARASTGFIEKQISLFTNPALNKFYQESGYVNLGNVHATSKVVNGETYYTRPYVMFGAHGSTGSIDAGLVWYQEHNKWMLFMSGARSGWLLGKSYYNNGNSMTKAVGTANGTDAYLELKCSDGKAHIVWRSPETWKIIDEQAAEMGDGFNTTSEIELVRENTLAQGVSGSYLKNVTWRTVYLYSTSKTAKAEKGFFKSARNQFTTYSGNYLTKGTGQGSATNLNYYGETMSLSIP